MLNQFLGKDALTKINAAELKIFLFFFILIIFAV